MHMFFFFLLFLTCCTLPHHLIRHGIRFPFMCITGMVDGKLGLYNRTSAKEGTLAGSMGGFLFREQVCCLHTMLFKSYGS